MQRLCLKADRNIGFSAIDSDLALKVAGSSASGFFHQDGASPQRIGANSRPNLPTRHTSIVDVGAILYRGWRLRGSPDRPKKASISVQL